MISSFWQPFWFIHCLYHQNAKLECIPCPQSETARKRYKEINKETCKNNNKKITKKGIVKATNSHDFKTMSKLESRLKKSLEVIKDEKWKTKNIDKWHINLLEKAPQFFFSHDSSVIVHTQILHITHTPVGLRCRIYRLQLCRGLRPLQRVSQIWH